MQVRGGAGVDRYEINGTGNVRLDFRGGANGVDVNLATGVIANDGFGNVETITGSNAVWEVQGTDFNDRIVGSETDESFILRGGNDTLDGGGGFDRLRFDRPEITGGVTVDLNEGTAAGLWSGQEFSHTITNIENVRGSSFADTISDSLNNDVLEGGGDADTFRISGGIDRILDFQIAADLLEVSSPGLSDAQVQTAFLAATDDGFGNAIVDFGNGSSLTFEGLSGIQVQALDPFSGRVAEPVTPPFTIHKTIVGDTITLDFVLDPDAAALDGGAGLGSFGLRVDLDPLALDYVEGSFAAAQGFLGAENEDNSDSGNLILGGIALSEFTDFSQPVFSFDAVILDRSQSTTVDISDVEIDGVLSTAAPQLADYTLLLELTNPVQGDVLIVGEAI
jgi:hypothetical protein